MESSKAFLVTVNDDLIKVKKLKSGKWHLSRIEKRENFYHFKELQEYLRNLDNKKSE